MTVTFHSAVLFTALHGPHNNSKLEHGKQKNMVPDLPVARLAAAAAWNPNRLCLSPPCLPRRPLPCGSEIASILQEPLRVIYVMNHIAGLEIPYHSPGTIRIARLKPSLKWVLNRIDSNRDWRQTRTA